MNRYPDYQTMGNTRPTDWKTRRKKVLKRDGKQCQNCGRGKNVNLEVHHVVPIKDGGGNVLSNLITLCRDCHSAIHNSGTAPTINQSSKEKSRRSRSTNSVDTSSISIPDPGSIEIDRSDWKDVAEPYTCSNCEETIRRTGWFPYFEHFRNCGMPAERPQTLSVKQWEEVKERIENIRSNPPSEEALNNVITPVGITETCRKCQDGWVELHHVVQHKEQENSKIKTANFLMGECIECTSKFKIDGGIQKWP